MHMHSLLYTLGTWDNCLTATAEITAKQVVSVNIVLFISISLVALYSMPGVAVQGAIYIDFRPDKSGPRDRGGAVARR